MPRFAITQKAGRNVAGHNNTGVGTVLVLSDAQADAAVAVGHLAALDRNVSSAPAKKKPVKKPTRGASPTED